MLHSPRFHIESAQEFPLRPKLRGLTIAVCVVVLVLISGSKHTAAQEPANTDSTAKKAGDSGANLAPTDESENERAAGIPTNPVEIMIELRWWIVPFVLASVIALWFGIERVVVLRRGRVIPRAFVDRFLEHLEQGKLDAAGALKICEQSDSPVAAVFAHGVRKWGKPSVEVEQAIIDGGERQVSQLRKHLRVLNGVATVTPLMGLLGTVVGMIQAFNDIASAGAMGRADQLAVGIAMALLTTAFGLVIAIPALIMYMYLAGRVDALVMEMDLLAQNVVHLISAEGLMAKPAPRPKPPAPKAKRKRAESKEPV